MLTRDDLLRRDDYWNAGLLDVGEETYPNVDTRPSAGNPRDRGYRIPLLAALHVSAERYDRRATGPEIVPLVCQRGERQYVMAHIFRAVPMRGWADREATRLVTVGERLEKCGDAQAWYYPDDRVLVMWEVLAFRHGSRELDKARVADLWRRLESWLLNRFPACQRVATEGGDPAWERGVDWYRAMLERHGYAPADGKARGAWVKRVERERPR